MRAYALKAPAKVNLYLEIIGDRPDGYHELAMILQGIELSDFVYLRSLSTDEIRLRCNHPQVPTDRTNLAYRAAELMVQQFPDAMAQRGGVEITIDKRIPVAAGLAGGSSNAAAVLVGLDLLWDLGLTQIELQDLGAKLGSDVPFCIGGGTALATGRGEQLSELLNPAPLYVVLGKYRSLSVSTAWAYGTYRREFGDQYVSGPAALQERWHRVHSGPLVKAIAGGHSTQIGPLLYNDLERVVLPAHPQVQHLREVLGSHPEVLGAMMSGSGPTVFALTASEASAEAVREATRQAIADPDLELWVTRFCSHGIQVTE
ncbi:4-(cytidine 5'-diphospho)-2-C-methyl-D-erythritol kinase [Geitlerinema sp. PCC 7407]|uniref:4-(cytidine 5'-diphospho)-2-C-methyl-D-erythritol kinase n=1 Tax=Geitlerinema sp. PCC 7407 TaxID=1173025 RepID=UPI00029FA614|nr:4-(cytidine 5'-diphospho)-2-C-methyl-D-erythritol kinase [Geitlerinema sp. PCC 7407]AFY67515.1 4-diphosphocytidyl-2-C-methyl-D-erythritol kinase [Geitlerinema sp. PCC 7407]